MCAVDLSRERPMKANWIVIISFALFAAPAEVPAAPTKAFDSGQGPSDAAHQTLARRLRAGQPIRVTTDSTQFEISWAGATHEGVPYRNFEDGSGATFAAEPGDSAIAEWSEIRRLDVRGRATGTGWKFGFVVGALGGIAAGIGLSQMTLLDSSEPSTGEIVNAAVFGGAIGALGGSVAGAIIGSAFPKWNAIYRQK